MPSSSSTTTSAKSTARRASATDSFSSLSSTFAFLRMPAVSISRTGRGSPSGPASPVDRDRIAGDAGLGPGDQPLLVEHAVDQGRLAGVGPADDGELERPFAGVLVLLRPRPRSRSTMRPQMLEQVDHAFAMLGADRRPARRGRAHRLRGCRTSPARPSALLAARMTGVVSDAASGRSPRRAGSCRRGRRSGTGRRRPRAPRRSVCARIRPGRVSGSSSS